MSAASELTTDPPFSCSRDEHLLVLLVMCSAGQHTSHGALTLHARMIPWHLPFKMGSEGLPSTGYCKQ